MTEQREEGKQSVRAFNVRRKERQRGNDRNINQHHSYMQEKAPYFSECPWPEQLLIIKLHFFFNFPHTRSE